MECYGGHKDHCFYCNFIARFHLTIVYAQEEAQLIMEAHGLTAGLAPPPKKIKSVLTSTTNGDTILTHFIWRNRQHYST